MRALTLALVALAGLGSAAQAQNSVAPATTPAPAAAPTAPAAVSFSLDTPVEVLMADPRAKAVLDARLPMLARHPAYNMIKAMSLRQIQPISQGALTVEMLEAVGADLAAIH